MWDDWLLFMDKDEGSRYVFPMEPLLFHSFRGHLLSHISSFVDNSIQQSGSVAFQEAFSGISKLAGGVLFWFISTSTSNLSRQISGNHHGSVPGNCSRLIKHSPSTKHNPSGFCVGSGLKAESSPPVAFGNVLSFMLRFLHREAERLQLCSVLSLAGALIPPFDNLLSKVLALPLENGIAQLQVALDPRPCEVERCGCPGCSFPELSWARSAVEPRTGIEFPMILENILAGQRKSSLASEVLVGTGSKTMKIIKIKSLKVYAFGFYVHPNSVCEKLGQKYSSIHISELDEHHEFFQDLLREDIGMSVRLVINCKGMKIQSVRDAFEKSLRTRLLKTNPNTDFQCLRTFGSFFTKDIPIPAGTIVEFRRTADGKLITEIEGNQIGVVHSKDLCRAFFDMYIGNVPVSEQTKQEIGKNVASIVRKC